jgi:hypothetical protein
MQSLESLQVLSQATQKRVCDCSSPDLVRDLLLIVRKSQSRHLLRGQRRELALSTGAPASGLEKCSCRKRGNLGSRRWTMGRCEAILCTAVSSVEKTLRDILRYQYRRLLATGSFC